MRRELKEAAAFLPPWVQTLHALAVRTARAIDNAPDDKLSPLVARLVRVLDRIRAAGPVAPCPKPKSVGDEAEDFVNGLRKFGPK
ncbi:hypothetical protein [Arthrobacter sp. FW306-2-2C-D06B]|uniref:hypothetical protein n=1 Tax=Arthrobacter sp. FW306-2-2C-D06B TaxID=2879618 RepID=UPI001F233E26|nr:hypothetical protein [Arthrobacter sp. FW306-2-2C-D06B]UKA57515.1 hypothetical protein LFT47_14595 [Arthrobacter sp. FW306-2-2C-D06B]